MSIVELSSRYIRAYAEAHEAGQALAEALADLLHEVIPDIRGQLGWYDSDCVTLLSDAMSERTDRLYPKLFDFDYRPLDEVIQEVAEEAGREIPLIDTPGIYLTFEEQKRVREILRCALAER